MVYINDTTLKQKSKTKLKQFSLSSFMLSIMIIVVMILILVAPVRYAGSVLRGLKLFFTAVLPGLLPFMFLCKILTGLGSINKITKPLDPFMKKIFGINGNGLYAFLLSMLSGYPLGSRITNDLYNQGLIDSNTATKTAIFSSTPGAIYVIGAVGGAMLNSPKLGVIIYISCTLSTLISMLIINLSSKTKKNKSQERIPSPLQQSQMKTNNKNLIVASVQETVIGLLTVAFYISIFSLIIDLLTDIKLFKVLSYPFTLITPQSQNSPSISTGVMSGIIEMTNGAKALSSISSPLTIPLISSIVSFSGLSIIMQSFNFLSETPIKKCQFILAKILQAVLSFIICLLILVLFPIF